MYMCARESILKEIQWSYICVYIFPEKVICHIYIYAREWICLRRSAVVYMCMLGNRFFRKVRSHVYVCQGIVFQEGQQSCIDMLGIDFTGNSVVIYMLARESTFQESPQSCMLGNRIFRKISSIAHVCQGIDFAGKSAVMHIYGRKSFTGKSIVMYMCARESILQESQQSVYMCQGIDFTGESAVMYLCARLSILQESQQSYICVLGNRFYRKVSSHVYVLRNRFCRKVSDHIYVCQGIDFFRSQQSCIYVCQGIDFEGNSVIIYMCINFSRKSHLSYIYMLGNGFFLTKVSSRIYVHAREQIFQESPQSCICVLGNRFSGRSAIMYRHARDRFYRKFGSHLYACQGIDFSGKSAVMYVRESNFQENQQYCTCVLGN